MTSASSLRNGKADFDTAYNREDPRTYFEVLGSLDYVIPHHGQRVFLDLLAAQSVQRAVDVPHVLDLCCSYGINAALLTCDLTLAELEDRYRSAELSELGTEELVARDRTYYEHHRRERAPVVFGLDASPQAIRYGQRVGLLEYGLAENLEAEPPSPELAKAMAQADLLTVTGGVGYITARTFAQLYELAGEAPPWLAAFTLRRFSFHDIADVLAGYGLVTERLVGVTFPQRRFSSAEEREFTLRHLGAAGLDVTDREAGGLFHTDFYLSRPAAEVAERPLRELLPHLAGGAPPSPT